MVADGDLPTLLAVHRAWTKLEPSRAANADSGDTGTGVGAGAKRAAAAARRANGGVSGKRKTWANDRYIILSRTT